MARSTFKFFLGIISFGLLGLILVVGLAMGWVRYHSPISLNFLNTLFERTLSYPLGVTSARIAHSNIRWDSELGFFRFRLKDVTFIQSSLYKTDSRVIARLPALDVAMNPWRLLWGHTALERLSLVSPFVLAARDEEGALHLGFVPQNPSSSHDVQALQGKPIEIQNDILSHIGPDIEASEIAAVLQGVLTHPSRLSAGKDASSPFYKSVLSSPLAVLLSHVSSVATRDARVLFLDQKQKTLWTFPGVSVQLDRGLKTTAFHADVALTTQNDKSHVLFQGFYDVETQVLDITAKSASLKPSIVTGLVGSLPGLDGFDVPLSGVLSARLLIQDHVRVDDLAFDIHGEAGQLSFSDPLNVTLPVENLEFSAYAISHPGKGDADLSSPLFMNVFAWPESLEWDLSVDLGPLNLSEDSSPQNTYVSAVGTLITRDPSSDAEGHVTLVAEHMPVERLADFWPERLTPLPRTWILENMTVGTLGGTWELGFTCNQASHGDADPSIAVTDLSGQGYARNMTVSYLDGMPPIKKAEADLVFARDRLDMTLTHGVHQNLTITRGTIALQNLDQEDNDASLVLNVSGPLQEALALLDAEPLGYVEALGLEVAEISGQVDTVLSLDFPLQTDLTLAMVTTRAMAQVHDATLHDIALGRSLEKGDLSVEVDKERLNVKGSGFFDTVPVTFEWEERFAGRPFLKRYSVQANIHETYRRRSGNFLSFLPSGLVRGVAQLELTGVATSRQNHDLDLRVDFTPAHINVAALGWTKPEGTPAHVRATMHVRKGQISEIPSLSFRSGTAASPSFSSLEGKAFFGPGNRLIQAHFDDVRIGKNQASVHVASDQERDMLKVTVIGSVLDLSPLFHQDMAAKVGPPDPTVGFDSSSSSSVQDKSQHFPPLLMDVTFAKVLLASGHAVTALNGATMYQNRRFETADMTAILEDETLVTFDISPSDKEANTRRVHFVTEDAGLFARVLGIVETMRRGKAVVSGTLDHRGVLQGSLDVGPYRLIKTPLLTRLFSIASLTGIVDALTGRGIAFGSLDSSFIYDSYRERLVIKDFRTSGATLGMTGKGTVWFANNQLDVAGSIIPAYVFNSLLSHIPVIGWFLTGFEDGGGLVGVDYTIKGKVSAPQIKTNPLSALTPSFVRRLFSAGDDPVLPLPDPD